MILPDENIYMSARQALHNRIAEIKWSITQSKPLPAQLATVCAALQRARERKSNAVETLQQATEALEKTSSQVLEYESEVHRLEAEISKSSPVGNQNSIEKLAGSLQLVIAEMKSSEYVPEELIQNAKKTMEQLFADVHAVAELAKKSAAAEQLPTQLDKPARPLQRASTDPGNAPKAMRITGITSQEVLRTKGNLLGYPEDSEQAAAAEASKRVSAPSGPAASA